MRAVKPLTNGRSWREEWAGFGDGLYLEVREREREIPIMTPKFFFPENPEKTEVPFTELDRRGSFRFRRKIRSSILVMVCLRC